MLFRKPRRADMRRFGGRYSGYSVPTSTLSSSSICYSAGVGEDISFDMELIGATQCRVYAFDPTPRSIDFVRAEAAEEPRFIFQPIGLWHREETLRFYAPQDPKHVSHSVYNLQQTAEYFEAPCKRLSAVMKELGHDRLDVLKLNIEGAQYAVIESVMEDKVPVDVLCVAIDQPTSPLKVFSTVKSLQRYGYDLANVEGWTYTFVWKESDHS